MDQSSETVRSRFEAWMKKEHPLINLTRRPFEDRYIGRAQDMWEAWQASAREAQPARCPDCEAATRHAYSDATTPGFFHPKCAKHRIGDELVSTLSGVRKLLSVVSGSAFMAGEECDLGDCEALRRDVITANNHVLWVQGELNKLLECAREAVQPPVQGSDWPKFRCEGCGLAAPVRSLPEDWMRYGQSAKYRDGRGRWKLASWCEQCKLGVPVNPAPRPVPRSE